MDTKIRMGPEIVMVQNSREWKNRAARKRRVVTVATIGALLCISLYTSILISSSAFHNTQIYTHEAREKRSVDNNTLELSSSVTFYEDHSPVIIPENICVTPACYDTASEILHKMNENADPCENFYEFVCGGFIQRASIPDDKVSIGIFSEIIEETHRKLKDILDEAIMPEELTHVKMTKNIYKSCLNEQAIDERGHDPLLTILRKLGNWPVLEDNWNENNFHWTELQFGQRELANINSFLSVTIDVDFKNNTKKIIILDQPNFGILREFLLKGMNNSIVKSYYKYMVDIAVLLGAHRQKAEEELLESLEFERQLANISLPLSSQRNLMALYNPVSLRELSRRYPSVPWKTFLNRLFDHKVIIDDDEIVNVAAPSFLSQFEILINNTSHRTIANYGLWRIVAALATHLSQDIRLRLIQFNKEYDGTSKSAPRWIECLRIVVSHLPLSIGSLYVKKHFNEEAKNTTIEMVDDIRAEFGKILRKADWIDDSTRQSALEKLTSVVAHVAYPDEFLNDEEMESHHKILKQPNENFFENLLSLELFRADHSIADFRKPYNKENWKYHGNAAVVNAFYSFDNSIELPAAILQGKFFDDKRPKYMNYAAIGFIIAHEITHGFDDQGRLFDKTGKLTDWWASLTKEKFLRKAECIMNQYSNYTESTTGLCLNGMNTLGENIADNGGMKVAYSAYNEWVSRNGQEQLLPSLNFTQQQLFWISAANVWCSKVRPEMLKLMISEGFHSPDEIRVIGTMSNLVEFAKDFECETGTRMNPTNKCIVW